MKYRPLGRSDLKVSLLCLGSMTWGAQNTQSDGHAQLDHAVDAGINFIDTAEMYPIPARKETHGRTETILGHWLKKRSGREKLIIASKIVPATSHMPYVRNGRNRLDRQNIEAAVNASLARLQTDYIDLYQLHWPERDTNYFGQLDYYHAPAKDGVPLEETLAALNNLIKTGKIRYAGVSNETPWGVAECLRLSRELNLPRIVSIQNPYNLLNRTFEIGLAEFSQREQVSLLAYSPMGFGALSGKYLQGQRPAGARLTLYADRYKRYMSDTAVACTQRYVAIAEEFGLDAAQMALAFVNQRPFVTSTIIGATTMEQLKSNIRSVDMKLDKNVLKKIAAVHQSHSNPCP